MSTPNNRNLFHRCDNLIKYLDPDTFILMAKCPICDKRFNVEEMQDKKALGENEPL